RVQAESSIAAEHNDLLVRTGRASADPKRHAHTHRAKWPRTEAATRNECRDDVPRIVQDLLTVGDKDRIAVHEVTHLLAQPQWMDRGLRTLRRCLLHLTVFRIDCVQALPPIRKGRL